MVIVFATTIHHPNRHIRKAPRTGVRLDRHFTGSSGVQGIPGHGCEMRRISVQSVGDAESNGVAHMDGDSKAEERCEKYEHPRSFFLLGGLQEAPQARNGGFSEV